MNFDKNIIEGAIRGKKNYKFKNTFLLFNNETFFFYFKKL